MSADDLESYVLGGLRAGERQAPYAVGLAAAARRRAVRARRVQAAVATAAIVAVGAISAAAYATGVGDLTAPAGPRPECVVSRTEATPRALAASARPDAAVATRFLRAADLGAGWSPSAQGVRGAAGPLALSGPGSLFWYSSDVVKGRDQRGGWETILRRVGADPEWMVGQRVIQFSLSTAAGAFATAREQLICTEGATTAAEDPSGRWVLVRSPGPFAGRTAWSAVLLGEHGLVSGLSITTSDEPDVQEPSTAPLVQLVLAAQSRLDGRPPAPVTGLPVGPSRAAPTGFPSAGTFGAHWRVAEVRPASWYGELPPAQARCVPPWPVPERGASHSDVAVGYRYWDGKESRLLDVRIQHLTTSAADALMRTGSTCDPGLRRATKSSTRERPGIHFFLTGDLGLALIRHGDTVATVTTSADLTDKDKLLESLAPVVADALP